MEVDLLNGADVPPPPTTATSVDVTSSSDTSLNVTTSPDTSSDVPMDTEDSVAHVAQPPEVIVRKLFNAIRGGDLRTIRCIFSQSTDEQIAGLLSARENGAVLMRRPSNGREVYIRNPTPLIMAVTEWFTEIVEFISEFKLCLDEASTVDDVTNTDAVYGGVSALHLAAMAGKLKMVQTLLRNGAKVNKQTTIGDSALFEACFEGHQKVVEELIDAGGDLKLPNSRDVSCLMIASYADNADVIKFIVDSGVDLNRVDKDGRNVLFYVSAEGRLDTMCYLLDRGTKVKADNHKVNILMEAVYNSQAEIVKYIVRYKRELGLSLDDVDDSGRNVLFYLVHQESTDMLEYLLTEGVPISPALDGRTLLMTATLKDNRAIIGYLVKNADKLGLDVRQNDLKGRNALFYCITGSELDIFDMLLRHGVSVEPSVDGVTLIMQAVAKHREDYLQHLLADTHAHGLDVNTRDRDGWNSLMYAVASGHLDLFEMLVDGGARTHPAADGRTVLMQGAAKGDVEFLRYLLDNARDFGVYVNERDRDGWNALFYTIQGGHMESFKYLLKRGARVCSALNGSTLLMEAVDKDKVEFVRQILTTARTLGIDVNQRDKDGNGALFYAAAAGNTELFRRLLDAGCEVHCDNHERTLLMQASLHGHADLIQYLLNNALAMGIDILQTDKDGRNAIFYCIEGGHQSVIQNLLDHGLPLVNDISGKNNLMQAARAANEGITKYLLQQKDIVGLDVNTCDSRGENALFYGARSKSVPVVELLLSNNVKITENHTGINVLSQTMCDRNDVIASAFLRSHSINSDAINGKDVKGRTVLHHLVERGDLNRLVTLGGHYDPDRDTDLSGTTILMSACRHTETMEIICHLCEAIKVNVHAIDNRGRSAIFYAIEAGHLAAVDYLLKQMRESSMETSSARSSTTEPKEGILIDLDSGIDGSVSSICDSRTETVSNICGETVSSVDVSSIPSDTDGLSALMVAVVTGNQYVVETLLRGVDPEQVGRIDKRGRTAVHYSAMHGYTGIMDLVLGSGAALDQPDLEGLTPLMLAASHGKSAPLAVLLRRGADPEVQDKSKRSALHHCFLGSAPSLRCVRFLVRYGAAVNQRDSNGTTSLMLACAACASTQVAVIRHLAETGGDPILQDAEGKDSFDHCPFDANYARGVLREQAEMDSSQKEALAYYSERLMTDLELNGVLRGLLKEQIFTKTLNFEVMKRPGPERVPRLIEILHSRGHHAFRAFCRVLKDMSEAELAYGLQKEAYRREQEIFW